MSNRRTFIKQAAALGTSGMFSASLASSLVSPSPSPVVLSTWSHGIAANTAAWAALKEGGTIVDAVEAGVKIPESDPGNMSVGLGGLPDRDGHVSLDACIMDPRGNCGAVAALEHIENPVSVARLVMSDTPHVMLVGEGALAFALTKGFKKQDLLTEKSRKAWEVWKKTSRYHPEINIENHDTIGLLAMDGEGQLAGACTTSGLAFKMRGRVGDSPIIGAGLFVDNDIGGATATGMGEAVIKIAGSHTVVELMRQGYEPEAACRMAVERLMKKEPDYRNIQIGFLALRKDGAAGGFALQKGFNYALMRAENNNRLIDSGFKLK